VPDVCLVAIAAERVVWHITQMQYLLLNCLTQVLGLSKANFRENPLPALG